MATTKTINDFKSYLKGGGARNNLFEVSIPSFPSAVSDFWSGGSTTGAGAEQGQKTGTQTNSDTSTTDLGDSGAGNENATFFNFMCKAASLPASTVAPIPVAFRGRELKVAGDRTFDPWTVTVINDEGFNLRTAFEAWANKMSKLSDATGVTNPGSYMTDAYVKQLGRGSEKFAETNEGGNSSVLRTYKFYSIWPSSISAIDLSYDSTNQIEEFTVEFQVQWFTIGESDQVADGSAPGGGAPVSGSTGQSIVS